MSSSTSGAPRKYLSFFVIATCTPGWNDLKMNGPIDAGGFMLNGTSSMFFVVSVVLLSHCALNALLGRIPPAPAPPSAAVAGQKTFVNLIVTVLPALLTWIPSMLSVLPAR